MLAKRLRESRPSRPVILMTAYGSRELSDAAAHAGVAAVLPKPFDLDDALGLVTALLAVPTAESRGRPRP